MQLSQNGYAAYVMYMEPVLSLASTSVDSGLRTVNSGVIGACNADAQLDDAISIVRTDVGTVGESVEAVQNDVHAMQDDVGSVNSSLHNAMSVATSKIDNVEQALGALGEEVGDVGEASANANGDSIAQLLKSRCTSRDMHTCRHRRKAGFCNLREIYFPRFQNDEDGVENALKQAVQNLSNYHDSLCNDLF